MQNKKIISLFKKYSAINIAKALFCLDLFPSNISSQVKVVWLYDKFLSIPLNSFPSYSGELSYNEFNKLVSEIIKNTPEFPMLEDYCPVIDWGEVKVNIGEEYYRILYGGEIDVIYDWIECFKILYGGDKIGEVNPIDDMMVVCSLHDNIINTIDGERYIIETIEPGNFEIPNEEFYLEIEKFLKSFNIIVSNHLTTNLGEYNSVEDDILEDDILSGECQIRPFVRIEEFILPVIPRRQLGSIIDYWGNRILLDEHSSKKKEINARIIYRLNGFVKERFGEKDLINCCNAIDGDAIDEFVYSFGLVNEGTLLLFYIVDTLNENVQETKLLKSLNLINESNSILDNYRRQGLQFTNKLTIIPVGVRVSYNTGRSTYSVSKTKPGETITMTDMICILDECIDVEEVIEFFKYISSGDNETRILSSITDRYFSFKSNYGVWTEGVQEPNFVYIDLSVGNKRFDNLKLFYTSFPARSIVFKASHWTLQSSSGTNVFTNRNNRKEYFGSIPKGNGFILIRAPFPNNYRGSEKSVLIYQQLQLCISYYLKNVKALESSKFLKLKNSILQIHLYTDTHIQSDSTLHFVSHLIQNEVLCNFDYAHLEDDWFAIRLVINEEKFLSGFSGDTNASEIELINIIIQTFSQVIEHDTIQQIKQEMNKRNGEKPGFKIKLTHREFCYPELIKGMNPDEKDYLMAKKDIAKIIHALSIQDGTYTVSQGKDILDSIKKELVEDINKYVLLYNIKDAIPFLIGNNDAFLYENYKAHHEFISFNERMIDYEPVKRYTYESQENLCSMRNYRYLIEKFVQLQPNGNLRFNSEMAKKLLGLVDWLHVIQTARDLITYNIMSSGIIIKDDCSFEVIYGNNSEEDSKTYSETRNSIEVGITGNLELGFHLEESALRTLYKNVDNSFKKDIGIEFQKVINFFYSLSLREDINGNTSYMKYQSTNIDNIFQVLNSKESRITKDEVELILDFFMLKEYDVIRILHEDTVKPKIDVEPDLPIWEYNKRYARYMIRPFIKIEGEIFRGKVSLIKAMQIRNNAISDGSLPSNYKLQNTCKVVENFKRNYIDKALVEHISKVLAQKVYLVEKGFDFESREVNRSIIHEKVGDYDVMCYDENSNILRLIESKNISPKYCLKDMRYAYIKLFGEDEGIINPKKEIGKVITRHKYMLNHLDDLIRLIGRPIKKEGLEIKSVLVAQKLYRQMWNPKIHNELEILYLTPELLFENIGKSN